MITKNLFLNIFSSNVNNMQSKVWHRILSIFISTSLLLIILVVKIKYNNTNTIEIYLLIFEWLTFEIESANIGIQIMEAIKVFWLHY